MNRVECGIRDMLFKAHELCEICHDSPLVTVATHRMLLALLYRAFMGPTDLTGWKAIWAKGNFTGSQQIEDYLSKWYDRFWLFDDKHPFFQMAELRTKASISVNRLATETASGNNATLFDHNDDDAKPVWNYGETTRRLLASQAFALGFGKSGRAIIGGVEEDLPYSTDAIALRGMNVWLQGENIFQTLMANLIPREDSSVPSWELADGNQFRDRLNGRDRNSVSSHGTVDRFTWQSRLIRLQPIGGVVSRMFFTQGRSADKTPGDPMKVYRSSKEEGVSAIPLSSGRAAWRDAHTLLSIPVPGSNEHRPECFNLAARVGPGIGTIRAHVVGIASAPNKAGKFLLWRHERMPVPAALLSDVSLIERLGSLIQEAEWAATELYTRIKRVSRFYRVSAEREPNKNEWDDINKLVKDLDPRPAYWARLEQHFFHLLENLPSDWDKETEQWKADDQQAATKTWREQIKHEARRALEESIRALGTTARAIQAVARVRTDFNDDNLKPPAQKAAKAKAKGGKKKAK
jgi:CRISPR system Cascade subunit CasA